jgi:ElaB/YqjD/DUF883 family membrane-anchored ribosome-binding protein
MAEIDYNIQRFIQIRDEIHEEIKKITPNVDLLRETTKRFIAHFDVFKELSSNAEKQLESVIKNAAEEMAAFSSHRFQELTQAPLEEVIWKLSDSAKTAQERLDATTKINHKKYWGMVCIASLLWGVVGFSAGSFFTNKHHPPLSPQVLQTYQLGLELEKAWLKADEKTKRAIERLLAKKA